MSILQVSSLNLSNQISPMAASVLFVSPLHFRFANTLPHSNRAAIQPSILSKNIKRSIFCSARAQLATPTPPSDDSFVIKVNGRDVRVKPGTNIADACSDNNFFVPTLCYHPRLPPAGNCRVCLVEVVGSWKMVPACTTMCQPGMEINTDTPQVEENTRGMLQLLRNNHPNSCMNCESNGKCEFQDLIYRYEIPDAGYKSSLEPSIFEQRATHKDPCPEDLDISSDAIQRAMDKCIKCGRCVRACSVLQDQNILGFVSRGGHERVSTPFDEPLDMTMCIECGQCASYCPVGAITERPEVKDVLKDLASRRKIMIAQTAPAVRVALGEEMNVSEGVNTEGRMVQALREVGFDYVFDTNFSADLTIMEEGTELIHRLNGKDGPLPMFTSCCPAWINLVEKRHPELIPHLSTARSPQQMLGSMIKTYFAKKLGKDAADISVVSIMPCTAKKHEAAREEFSTVDQQGRRVRDVDHVLTTRELGHLLRLKHIPYATLSESEYDPMLGMSTGAGVIFGVTGGVMEAAIRSAQVLTGVENPIPLGALKEVRGLQGVKHATVDLKDAKGNVVPVKVAVVHGGANLNKVLKMMDKGEFKADFVEFMSCGGGCINGGGQPKSKSRDIIQKRTNAIYTADERRALRMSHENPMVLELYKDFLGEPCGEKSHHLLHTHYHDRSRDHRIPVSREGGHILKSTKKLEETELKREE